MGLRQLNYDLMDEVLPDINNVARHVRPFVVVAWAWKRAFELAQKAGESHIARDVIVDFVDRIEVLFVASQLAVDPASDLPGSDYLRPFMGQRSMQFGGAQWKDMRKARRYSTSLSSPLNYGPGLRSLGWVVADENYPWLMCPSTEVLPALAAFEQRLGPLLKEEAFSKLGPVAVASKKLPTYAPRWALDDLTAKEKHVCAELLFGSGASPIRQKGGQLLLAAARAVGAADESRIRAAMAGEILVRAVPADLDKTQRAWRRVQMRQAFRLALESTLQWVIVRLESGPKPVEALVRQFRAEAFPRVSGRRTRAVLDAVRPRTLRATEQIDALLEALAAPEEPDLARSIASALAVVLGEADDDGEHESFDRLPLRRARIEAERFSLDPVDVFLRHVIESWVLAQHTFWSIGRGLADARAQGKVLLRLKVILDEGGWTLAPGATRGNPPRPTADRLRSAMSLAAECDLM